jgi:zinc transport system substrate-binding protein
MWSRISVTAAVLAAAATVAGCKDAPPPKVEAPRPLVVTSFYPLYDFARQVAGDRAEVISLVPAGVEPHDWEPSPRDVARVEKAAVFVYNGAGFDAGVERLARGAGKAVVVEATAGLALIDRDPHVWLDPTLAKAQAELIRAALAKADPAGANDYASRATAYGARLTKLDETFSSGLATCERRELVVSHAAFGYLARRYRLTQVPVMGLAPQAEPSPAELARVVRTVKRLKATVIFFETLVSPRLAETLAAEVGAKTMVLNPIEGLTSEEEKAGKDYMAVMDDNLRNIRTALGCQ